MNLIQATEEIKKQYNLCSKCGQLKRCRQVDKTKVYLPVKMFICLDCLK